ncbi:MAG: family 78 glycoside hydrolase catalytic domain [Rhodospirillales bacterium]
MKGFIIAVLALAPLASGQTLAVQNMRCEYLVNPLGIDVEKPRLSWQLTPGPRGRQQSAFHVLVASSLEDLQKNRGDLWDSGRTASGNTTFVEYAGQPLTSGMRAWWKVRVWDEKGRASAWSSPAYWSMGLLKESDWSARFIGMAHPNGVKEGPPLPFPWLRKNVRLDGKPQRATAYVNALGYYELYVNGKKVDDYVLMPTVVDYSKRTWYVTHDITNYLVQGDNTVALWLGRGWYVRKHPGVIHDGPLVRAQFDITLAGGKEVKVGTDATWKVKASPITPLGRGTAFGDYGGERYDARLELEGWNSVKLDDSGWDSAAVFDPPKVRTSADMVEPNRILETLKPVKIEKSPAGGWLIDMGKNYTGWLDLRLPSNIEAGRTIKIEYADAPPPIRNRYDTFNQRDEYITRAGAGQLIRSRFNYHAFRWAHVTGLDQEPSAADITGHFIRTAYGRASQFESSNDLLNRIYRLVTWTYECLTLGGYVVDCPTRERLGYGGDAGTSIETGLFNFDTGGLYSRWAANWRDAQDPESGDLPYTAPNYPDQGGGGPMWSGFVVTMPWQVYLHYGDKRVLETNYEMIQKWLNFANSKVKDGILEPYISIGIRMPQWNYLGDWVTPRKEGRRDISRHEVSARFINNAHYLYTLRLAARIAEILNRPADAAMYTQRADTLQRTLHQRFYDAANNSYATGEQPYLSLALMLGIAPPDVREAVMKNLEHTITVKDKGHFDSGMHGTYFLIKQLLEDNRNDLVYLMTSQKTYPSWGDMLEQGATTAWENWSGGSHIHDTLISIGSWCIQGIGGIRIDEKVPGFRRFILKPALVGDLTFARTRYNSIHGPIVSNWEIRNGTLNMDVIVPPGTTAELHLPSAAPDAVTESGRPVARAEGVKAAGQEKGVAIFELTSGSYRFTSKLP